MKIAVCMNEFPKISEKFILYEIKDLIDMGHDVEICALYKSDEKKTHPEVEEYKLLEKATFLLSDLPAQRWGRILRSLGVIVKGIFISPGAVLRCLSLSKTDSMLERITRIHILDRFLGKDFDVIHCHFGTVGSRLAFLKEIFPRTKHITTFHLYDLRLGMEKDKTMYAQLFRLVDKVISICNFNREKLIGLGCPAGKLVDHNNGIDIRIFSRTAVEKQGSELIVTTVARLVEQKNLFFGLDVIARLVKEGRTNFRYFLIGNGPLRNQIEQRIKDLGIQDIVVVFGELSSDEVIAQLRKTDIFFLPSSYEAFPTVVLESQSMGIPVVATDTGGTKETFLNERTGFLVPYTDPEPSLHALRRLLDSEQLRLDFGTAARRHVEEKFDIKKLDVKLIGIFSNN